jgi:ribonuclease Z
MLRDEAREVFDRTIVPRDFDRVDLPLPEKGEPVHVRVRDADLSLPEPRTAG